DRHEGLQAAERPAAGLLPDRSALPTKKHEGTSAEERRRDVLQQRRPCVRPGHGCVLRNCCAEHLAWTIRQEAAEVPRRPVEQGSERLIRQGQCGGGVEGPPPPTRRGLHVIDTHSARWPVGRLRSKRKT